MRTLNISSLLNRLLLRLTSSVEESLKMINFLGVYIVTPLIICPLNCE